MTSDKQYPFFALVKDMKHRRMSQYYVKINRKYHPADSVKPDSLFRRPAGLNYKNKPIVLFGCSFTWGVGLKDKQTFHYKLSNLTKRPVYNRALHAWGVQHMLYQLRREDFYSQVPKPEYVIYVYMAGHMQRMHKYGFQHKNIYFYLKYNEHFGKLYEEKRFQHIPYSRLWNWKILPFIARMKENNSKESFKLFEKHLLECRREIDNHWGKDTKFIILDYIADNVHSLTYEDVKKLKEDRIDVIKTSDLTDISLYNEMYWISKDDHHPSEKAWDVITPLFVEKLKELK